MKTITGIILTLLFCCAGVIAQEGTAPNREPLFVAPAADAIKEVTSKNKKMSIAFAGEPTITEDEKAQLGATTTYNYQAKFSDAQLKSIVAKGPFDKKPVYDHYRKTVSGLPSAQVTEKAFKVGKEEGVELSVIYTSNTMRNLKMRILVIDNKLYELKSSMVNWEMATDAEKQAFEAESARFFESFKLSK